MNIVELDNYNLADAVRFHDRLNHRLWDRTEHLHPQVKDRLMAVARDFAEFLGIPDLDIRDITISGSNAAYNYTENSDIDLHLVVEIPRVKHDEVYRELFNAKKYQYNDEHDIRIGGADVELYAQPSDQPHHSQGIYSLLRNAWVSVPRRHRAKIDDSSVRAKYEDLVHRIDDAVNSDNYERIANLQRKIKTMRQVGLEQQGEFGVDNIVFKLLRVNGFIKKLIDARNRARDRELSLNERRKKSKKRVRYGFGGYWTPGFSFGDSGEGGGDGGGGGESRAMESPDGVSPSTRMFLSEEPVENVVQQFIIDTAQRLGIERMPEVHLHNDADWSQDNHSFGKYEPETNDLHVNLHGRHLFDILRTTAHELAHCRQHEIEPLSMDAGNTGSDFENEAHAVAGIIMRDFADAHPGLFENASGYIPKNRREAALPQYAMALSVDIKPGQVGREANKLGLKTGRNGEPGLLMKSANLREGRMPQPSQGSGANLMGMGASKNKPDLSESLFRSLNENSNKKEAVLRIQKMLNTKYSANLDLDGVLGPLTRKSINKFMPNARIGLADEPNKTTAVQGKKIKENLSPQTIHKLADRKGVKWDNEPSFLALTKRLTGKAHLDDLDQAGLKKVKQYLDKQGVAEGDLQEIQRTKGDEEGLNTKGQNWGKETLAKIKMLPGSQRFGYTAGAAGRAANFLAGADYIIELFDIKHPQDGLRKAGFLALRSAPWFPIKNSYQVANVGLDSEYRGTGLGQNLYGIAMKLLGMTIVADDTQTSQARSSWLRLSQVPGVVINGYTSVFPDDWALRNNRNEIYDDSAKRLISSLLKAGGQEIGKNPHFVYVSFPVGANADQNELQALQKGMAIYSSRHPEDGGTQNGLYARWGGQVNEQGVAESNNQSSVKTGIYQTDVLGAKAYHVKCLEKGCDWESRRYDRIKQAQDAAKKHAQTHIKSGVAEQDDLVESLRQEFELLEDEFIGEIKMSPSNLRSEAAQTGALAGMEFEMIVPGVKSDDPEMEPDYDSDERCRSIDDAVEFFHDGDYNGRREVERLRERMQEDFSEWLMEKIDEDWDNDPEEHIYQYLVNDIDPAIIGEIIGEDLSDADSVTKEQVARAAKIVNDGEQQPYYDDARDWHRAENDGAWDESDWLDATDLDRMSAIESAYDITWPHWTYNNESAADIDTVANDFSEAVGMPVNASQQYHGGRREAGHYVVEPDGSLRPDSDDDTGLEFVSPPMPIDQMLDQLKKVREWAGRYGCYTNDSTGLHINVSVPEFSNDKLDYVKLALLLGDQYVLDQFGRSSNTYTKSALSIVQDRVRTNPKTAQAMLDRMRGHMEDLATKAIHSGDTSKYTSINTKEGYIEFRSPGGDWLDENFDKVENTLLRFTVALKAAMDPEAYREEYLKKLYKLLEPTAKDQKGSDTVRYFADYVAGKIPAAALRSFVKQAQLQRRIAKEPTGGKQYWWRVYKDGRDVRNTAMIEVVASSEQEARDKAAAEFGIFSLEYKAYMDAVALRPYVETEPEYEIFQVAGNRVVQTFRAADDNAALAYFDRTISAGDRPYYDVRRAGSMAAAEPAAQQPAGSFEFELSQTDIENRLGLPDQTGDANYEVVNRNTMRPVFVFIANTDADASRKYLDWLAASGLPNDTEDYGFRERARPGSTLDIQRQRADQSAQAAVSLARQQPATGGNFTGVWLILDPDGNVIHSFAGVGNVQSDANRVAMQWLRRNPGSMQAGVTVVPEML